MAKSFLVVMLLLRLMENIIYNELRYRGYNVDVGVVEFREKTLTHQLKKVNENDFNYFR